MFLWSMIKKSVIIFRIRDMPINPIDYINKLLDDTLMNSLRETGLLSASASKQLQNKSLMVKTLYILTTCKEGQFIFEDTAAYRIAFAIIEAHGSKKEDLQNSLKELHQKILESSEHNLIFGQCHESSNFIQASTNCGIIQFTLTNPPTFLANIQESLERNAFIGYFAPIDDTPFYSSHANPKKDNILEELIKNIESIYSLLKRHSDVNSLKEYIIKEISAFKRKNNPEKNKILAAINQASDSKEILVALLDVYYQIQISKQAHFFAWLPLAGNDLAATLENIIGNTFGLAPLPHQVNNIPQQEFYAHVMSVCDKNLITKIYQDCSTTTPRLSHR